jgi:hypothetical protein
MLTFVVVAVFAPFAIAGAAYVQFFWLRAP